MPRKGNGKATQSKGKDYDFQSTDTEDPFEDEGDDDDDSFEDEIERAALQQVNKDDTKKKAEKAVKTDEWYFQSSDDDSFEDNMQHFLSTSKPDADKPEPPPQQQPQQQQQQPKDPPPQNHDECDVISIRSSPSPVRNPGRSSIASCGAATLATLGSASSPSWPCSQNTQLRSPTDMAHDPYKDESCLLITQQQQQQQQHSKVSTSEADEDEKLPLRKRKISVMPSDSLAQASNHHDDEVEKTANKPMTTSKFSDTEASLNTPKEEPPAKKKQKKQKETVTKSTKAEEKSSKTTAAKPKKNKKGKKETKKTSKLQVNDHVAAAPVENKSAEVNQSTFQSASTLPSKNDKENKGTTSNHKTSSAVENAPIKKKEQDPQVIEGTKKSTVKKPAAATKESAPATYPAQETKKKKKKMTFQDQVLKHMLFSFKPFTLKSLAEELQSTDTQLNYLMLSLLDKGLVTKKEFASGKSGRSKTLYWAIYGAKTKEVNAYLATPDEIEKAKAELHDLSRNHEAVKKAMLSISSEMSNEELDRTLATQEVEAVRLRKEVQEVKSRISIAKQRQPPSSVRARHPPKSEAELAREKCPRRLKIRVNHMRDEWLKRKRKCMDVVEMLADGMEKKPKDVIKLLEIETDEMESVQLPPKHEVDNKK